MKVDLETSAKRRIGRPPLKRNVATIMLSVRLPADVVALIDERVGPDGARGEWIRKAIDKALKANLPSRPSRATFEAKE